MPFLKMRMLPSLYAMARLLPAVPTEGPVSVAELLRDEAAAAVNALRRIMQTNVVLVVALAWCVGVWIAAVALVQLYVL